MNDLIKIENGVIAPKTINMLCEYETALKKLKETVDDFKKALLTEMEIHNVKKFENDNVVITYIEPTDRESFDSKTFKKELPDVYDQYVKISPVKASVRVKVK